MLILLFGLTLIAAGIARHSWVQASRARHSLKPLSFRQADTWERRRAKAQRVQRRSLFINN